MDVAIDAKRRAQAIRGVVMLHSEDSIQLGFVPCYEEMEAWESAIAAERGRTMTRATRKWWILGGILVAIAIILAPRRVQTPTVPGKEPAATTAVEPWNPAEVAESVVLIGDAGDALPTVWEPLVGHLKQLPSVTTVLLLGDNIYNVGIPPENDPEYPEATRRLRYLIEKIQQAGVRGVFIPGNHDWNADQIGGLRAVERQQQLVLSALGPDSFVPRSGCPGPATALSNERFQVVAIDSEWWMYQSEKPPLDGVACPQNSSRELADDIASALKSSAPSAVRILAMHHPLMSRGNHGDGSGCPGDFGCPAYKQFRKELFETLSRVGGVLCVGGHDHSLQLLQGAHGCQLFLVSGATSHLGWTKVGEDTIFASEFHGFMRVDALKRGGHRLTVFKIDLQSGAIAPLFSKLL